MDAARVHVPGGAVSGRRSCGRAKPARKPWPPIYAGGESEAAKNLIAREVDAYVMHGDPPATLREKISEMRERRARLAPHAPPLQFGVAGFVVCRAKMEQAQAELARITNVRSSARGYQNYQQWLSGTQLEVTIDAAGQLVGRRPGRSQTLPPLVTGSHIDSVPEAGNYDGNVGSISAIEVAHALADNNIITRHPLEIIIFQNEEGGLIGSRAITGELREKELDPADIVNGANVLILTLLKLDAG